MSDPASKTTASDEILELLGPGGREAVEAARADLYARFPDQDERRRALMSHLVRVEIMQNV